MSSKEDASKEQKQSALKGKQRWSVRRKREVVMRLLHGEPLDTVSREVGVEVYRLEQWREKSLLGMEEALKDRTGDPLQKELDKAMQHIGELSMECEVLRKERELRRPFVLRRSSK
jgi:transposase